MSAGIARFRIGAPAVPSKSNGATSGLLIIRIAGCSLGAGAAVSTGAAALIETLRSLDDAGIHPLDVSLKRPSLDDVFLSLTGHAAEEKKEEVEVGGRRKKAKK